MQGRVPCISFLTHHPTKYKERQTPELRTSIRPCFPNRQHYEPEQRAHFQLRKDLMRTKSSLPALQACSPHSCPHPGKPWPVGKAGRSTTSKLRGGGRGPHRVRRPSHMPVLNERPVGGSEGGEMECPHSCQQQTDT